MRYFSARSSFDTATLLPQDPLDLAPDLDPVPSLRCSNRITCPPDCYGFSHAAFLATLYSVVIPNSQ